MKLRRGFSVTELLVALVLTTLLVAVLIGVLVAQTRLGSVIAQRSSGNDAVRSASFILSGEVRRTTPYDLRALTSDSLALRAFRGAGIICAVNATEIRVRYRGDRLPNADKDSALIIHGDSVGVLRVVESRTVTGTCTPAAGETLVAMRFGAINLPPDGVVLIFESGSYYLSTRALRYRIGAEGRQPLTAELFKDATTQFLPAATARAPRLTLGLNDERATAIVTGFGR
jgi:hypothetical protein